MRTFIKKQFTKRGFWFSKKTPVLLDRWKQELKIDVEFVIAHRLLKRNPLKFVQIGAFDGASNDFLASFIARGMLKGVMVEPEPRAFAALQKLYYGNSSVQLLQCAIAKENGVVRMYRVKAEFNHLAEFAPQLTSMDPNNIRKWMKDKVTDVDAIMESFEVPAHSPTELLKQYKLEDLDILQIDTEGFDAEIIRMMPFETIRPVIISFEILNLSDFDKNSVYNRLMDYGYSLSETKVDCVAYHRECI